MAKNKSADEKFKLLALRKATEFLKSDARNQWIQAGPVSLYLRKSKRAIEPGVLSDCVDVATITVHEDSQNKGFGAFSFIAVELAARSHGKFQHLYVENAMDPRLQNHLLRNGFSVKSADPCGGACLSKPL